MGGGETEGDGDVATVLARFRNLDTRRDANVY